MQANIHIHKSKLCLKPKPNQSTVIFLLAWFEGSQRDNNNHHFPFMDVVAAGMQESFDDSFTWQGKGAWNLEISKRREGFLE